MWKFIKHIADKKDVEVFTNELDRYIKLCKGENYDGVSYFSAGFNRGVEWGVFKSQQNVNLDNSAEKAQPGGETNTAMLQLLKDILKWFDLPGFDQGYKKSDIMRRIVEQISQQQHS